jgi:hypothetical protein
MTDWLRSGEESQIVERLVTFGVGRQDAEYASSEDMEWLRIQTSHQAKHALLFVPCTLDYAQVYVMAWQNTSWHVTDHANFDCHYDESVALDIKHIRNRRFEEVQVHHACEGHGTGFLQQDFKVFAIENSKLRLELDTEEVVNSSPTAVDHPHNLQQTSVFVLIPLGGSSSRAIEETRSRDLNGKLSVQRRFFRWNADKGRYTPGRFSPVEAP